MAGSSRGSLQKRLGLPCFRCHRKPHLDSISIVFAEVSVCIDVYPVRLRMGASWGKGTFDAESVCMKASSGIMHSILDEFGAIHILTRNSFLDSAVKKLKVVLIVR